MLFQLYSFPSSCIAFLLIKMITWLSCILYTLEADRCQPVQTTVTSYYFRMWKIGSRISFLFSLFVSDNLVLGKKQTLQLFHMMISLLKRSWIFISTVLEMSFLAGWNKPLLVFKTSVDTCKNHGDRKHLFYTLMYSSI